MRWTVPARLGIVLSLTLSLVGVGVQLTAPAVQAASGAVPVKDWATVTTEAARFFKARTGMPLTLTHDFVDVDRLKQPDPHSPALNEFASTYGVDSQGATGTGSPAVICRTYLREATATRGIIAHEIFHCLQLQVLGNDVAFQASADWVAEGSAAYAGCSFVGGDKNDIEVKDEDGASYYNWLTQPGFSLFARPYEAIGFWGLLEQAGRNPYRASLAAVKANGNPAAYLAAVGPQEKAVLNLWASSRYRDPNRSPAKDWDTSGPCVPTHEHSAQAIAAAIDDRTLLFDDKQPIKAKAYTVAEVVLKPAANARVMHVVATSGTVRVNGKSADRKAVKDSYFCVKKGGCTCPKGMAFTEGDLVPLGPSDPFPAVAVAAGQTQANVMVSEVPFKCSPAKIRVIIKGAHAGYPEISFRIKGNADTATVDGHKLRLGIVNVECPPKCNVAFTGRFRGGVASDVLEKPALLTDFETYGYPYAMTSINGSKLPPDAAAKPYLEENGYSGIVGPCSVNTKRDVTITITLVYRPFVALVGAGTVWESDDNLLMDSADISPNNGDENDFDPTCWGVTDGAAPVCAWHMYPGSQAKVLMRADASGYPDSVGGPCAGQGLVGPNLPCTFTVGTADTVIPVVWRPSCQRADCTARAVQPNPLPPGFVG